MLSTGIAKSPLRGVWPSFAVRWLLALSCVTCAVIERNEAMDSSDGAPYLVFTSSTTIYRVNTDGSSPTVIINSGGFVNKLGIDFDYRNGRLYWVDSTQLRIMSSKLNGTDVEVVTSSGFENLERLAYDWVTEKVYWSDYGAAEIGIVDVDTGRRTVLIVTGEQHQSEPRSLALDPIRRNMYWADWLEGNGEAVIETASMDGQNRRILISDDLSRPYDLSLDLDAQKLYFVDGYYDRIESINTDGTGRALLYTFHNNVVPFSMVFHDGFVFWTERRSRTISRLQIREDGDGEATNFTVNHERPAGLAVVAPQRQPSASNPCPAIGSKGGCSHICLLSSTDPRQYSCACPDSGKLSEDQLTCKEIDPTGVTTPTTSVVAPSPTPSSTPSPTPPPTPPACECMNGGVCSSESGGCLCLTNYTGDLCEIHRNSGVCELAVDPLCQNEGTCRDIGVFEYECVCPPDYEGRNCEKRKNYGVCNETMPCRHGICSNSDDGTDYTCHCLSGFIGRNCTEAEVDQADSEETSASTSITPVMFVGVVAGFAGLVLILVVVVICVFTMLHRERSRLLESASSRSNSPMIKKRRQFQSEKTPSSTDTSSRDYWLTSQPSINHGHTNIYSQEPQRGLTPQALRKYSRPGSFDELSREEKILTV